MGASELCASDPGSDAGYMIESGSGSPDVTEKRGRVPRFFM